MPQFEWRLSKRRVHVYASIVGLVLTYYLLAPFAKYNDLSSWDMVGHLSSAWYVKESLFPMPYGWNPFFYGGFPQNQFYPPLFSYLSAGFSYIIGLEWSFKSLVALSIVATPIAFYYFCRKHSMNPKISIGCTMVMIGFLFMFPELHMGGTFKSTFDVGLVANAAALPILFFYLGRLSSSIRDRSSVWTISILLALMVLTHNIVALVGGIAFLCYISYAKWDRSLLLYIVKHGVIVGGLTAFWLLPFITNVTYLESVMFYSTLEIYYVVLAVGCGLLLLLQDKRSLRRPVYTVIGVLSAGIVVGELLEVSFHYYRLEIYILLFAIWIVFSYIPQEWSRIVPFVSMIFLLASAMVYAPSLNPAGYHDKITDLSGVEHDGRAMILTPPSEEGNMFHYYQHQMVLQRQIPVIRGLFAESSPHADVVLGFHYQMGSPKYGQVRDFYAPGFEANWYQYVVEKMDALGISAILSDDRLRDPILTNNDLNEREIYLEDGKMYKYTLNRSIPLVEPIKQVKTIDPANRTGIRSHFYSRNANRTLLLVESIPDMSVDKAASVRSVDYERGSGRISFTIDSEERVPVLVKVSHFKNWRAYNKSGQIPIYRASPGFMAVYSRGPVVVTYQRTWVEIIGILVTLFALAVGGWRVYRTKLIKG